MRFKEINPLTIIIALVSALVVFGIIYELVSMEINFFKNPSDYPTMRVWNSAVGSSIVFMLVVSFIYMVLKYLGWVKPNSDKDSQDQS